MEVNEQTILQLSVPQAGLFHAAVLDYLNRHIGEVLDYGLMDDIILSEYEANVNKLASKDTSEADREQAKINLASMLYSMLLAAQDHIDEGTPYPIFADFVKYIKENAFLLYLSPSGQA